MSELNKRLISAAVLITLFSYFIYDASYIGIAATDLIFVIILWEFLSLIKHKRNRIIFICIFALLSLILPIVLMIVFDPQDYNSSIYIFSLYCISWCLIAIWVFRYDSLKLSDLRVSVLGSLILIPALHSLFIVLSNPLYPLIIVATVAIADTTAYFGGKLLGKTKILPKVSPGKTLEGLVSALLATPLIISTFAYVYGLNFLEFIFFGVVVTLISFIGDVSFSLLKRNRGIKQSSNLIPGHGGFIDLLDGVIAVLPFFSFSALLVFYSGFDFGWVLR
ncbi:MAG: phosphatidate cytidylyltransferase [Gammaproteobacteria bacterium]|nr:phosphatidate cytidylyltransferase [Gammaproteobacteria bacterium]